MCDIEKGKSWESKSILLLNSVSYADLFPVSRPFSSPQSREEAHGESMCCAEWEKDLPHLVVVVSTKDAIIASVFLLPLRSSDRQRKERLLQPVALFISCERMQQGTPTANNSSPRSWSSSESCTRMKRDDDCFAKEMQEKGNVYEFTFAIHTTPACPSFSSCCCCLLFLFLSVYLLLPISFVVDREWG